uniref:BTB domain-containing protein n=1 Tax=Biomphalaria glabrata TaxID=6526 RepID=A0A2C9JL26_BIOGL
MDELASDFVAESFAKDNWDLLYQFYQNQTFCDVEITIGNKHFHCHRLVLACVSQYFRAMFNSRMAEATEKSITIKDIDEEAMEKLIQFAYTSHIRLNTDNVQSILYAASILQIEAVANACSRFMQSHLHPSNCIEVRSFAEAHNRVELIKTTDNYIRDNFIPVSQTDEFLSMPIDILAALVSSPDLNVDNEEQVFVAVLTWIKHDLEHRCHHLSSLMSKVDRFLKERMLEVFVFFLFLSFAPSFEFKGKGYLLYCRRGIALACSGDVIYAVGGLDDATCFNTVERYDPGRDNWSFIAPMETPRGGVGVATLKGQLYALGGNDGTSSLDSCERYDPYLNRWSPIAAMCKRRAGAGVAVLDGYIYVVGGFDDNSPLDCVEKYDVKTNTWTRVANMSCCRGGVGVSALGGRLYAVGGHDGCNYLNSVEAYDPLTNKWEPAQGIEQYRAGAGVAYCDCSPKLLRQVTSANVTGHL